MVIIKGYKMPHNCYDCDLHNYHECDITCESIEEDYCWNGDSREKHCPLREVETIPKYQYKEPTTKNDLGVDCVSRQFMYELGATCIATRNENGKLIALGAIEELPLVRPQNSAIDLIWEEIENIYLEMPNDYNHPQRTQFYLEVKRVFDRYRNGEKTNE